jgi:hypothetical protein
MNLKVCDLIEKLKEMPQEAFVITEGCDCYGTSLGVELNDEGIVEITRVTEWKMK